VRGKEMGLDRKTKGDGEVGGGPVRMPLLYLLNFLWAGPCSLAFQFLIDVEGSFEFVHVSMRYFNSPSFFSCLSTRNLEFPNPNSAKSNMKLCAMKLGIKCEAYFSTNLQTIWTMNSH
jgi:hypothetical protein